MKKAILISFLALIVGSQVMAAGLVPCGGGDPEPPCELCHFFVMGKNVIDTLLLKIIPPVAVLFVIIGGTYFILGSGYDPSLISKAKAIFWSVGVGLLIIYASWLAVNLFFTVIGVASWTGLAEGWWKIDCPI